MNKFLSIFALTVLLGACASAYAGGLKSSVDYAVMYSDQQASVYYWTTNPLDEEAFISFSADTGELNGVFDSPFGYLESGEAKGVYLTLTSPDCLHGAETVYVTAQLCTASGACSTESRRLVVEVTPSDDCTIWVNGSYSPQQYYYPSPAICGVPGECDEYGAIYDYAYEQTPSLSFTRFYEPTEVEAVFYGDSACLSIASGEWGRAELSLFNTGAAGTFELSLIGDTEEAGAVLGQDYVSLGRNQLQEVFIDFQPSRTRAGGRYWMTLQAIRDGVVATERDVCVDVPDTLEARIVLPAGANVLACGSTEIKGTAANLGTRYDYYSFIVPSYASVTPSKVGVAPGEVAEFSIQIDASKVPSGTAPVFMNVGVINADGAPVALRGEGVVALHVQPCSEAIEASATQEDDYYKVVARVDNALPGPLENVSVEVINLPEGWSVLAESGFDVPANSQREVTLWVKPGDGEARGTLVVKSNGVVVGSSELPVMKASSSGLTGYVTYALSQNAWFIAFLVLVALLVIVLSGRKGGGQKKLSDAGVS
ncbi:MAG: hypothetical protein WC607_00240 [Candidatus Micrarchaeia archaeon]